MEPVLRSVYAAFLLLLFAGCAQVGLPTANTFNERLAVGYGTVAQIRTSALDLLKAKKLSAEDAQNINNQADHARAGLDIARTISKTDPAAANAKLTAIHTALVALQSYLAMRGK